MDVALNVVQIVHRGIWRGSFSLLKSANTMTSAKKNFIGPAPTLKHSIIRTPACFFLAPMQQKAKPQILMNASSVQKAF